MLDKTTKDTKWVEEQKAGEEKFGMYLQAVKVGAEALEVAKRELEEGKTGLEEAKKLVDGNKDAVSAWLDKKVSRGFGALALPIARCGEIG